MSVAVEVIVVVDELVSAMASRGRRRAVATDEMRILSEVCTEKRRLSFMRMSTIVISTAMRCDDGTLRRSDRMFQYIPSAIKEMLLSSCSCVLFRAVVRLDWRARREIELN